MWPTGLSRDGRWRVILLGGIACGGCDTTCPMPGSADTMEETTRSLSAAIFSQDGAEHPHASRILEPSEASRRQMDYYSHTKNAAGMIERLAAARPTTLACMHGSAGAVKGRKCFGHWGRDWSDPRKCLPNPLGVQVDRHILEGCQSGLLARLQRLGKRLE